MSEDVCIRQIKIIYMKCNLKLKKIIFLIANSILLQTIFHTIAFIYCLKYTLTSQVFTSVTEFELFTTVKLTK